MSHAHNVETGSPSWCIQYCETRFHRLQRGILSLLDNKFGDLILVAISFLLGLGLIFFREKFILEFFEVNSFLFQFVSYVLPILSVVLLFPVALLPFSKNTIQKLIIVLFFIALLVLFQFGRGQQQAGPLAVALFIAYVFPLIGYAFSLLLRKKWRLVMLGISVLLSGICLAYAPAYVAGNWKFLYFVLLGIPLMPLSFFIAENNADLLPFQPLSLPFFTFYFSPLTLNYFLAVRSEQILIRIRDRGLFLKALLNIITGMACITVARYLSLSQDHPWFGTNYLFVFFSTWGVLRVAVGLGQALGFPLDDPFHYPLLAATPLLHWRRWNTYFYHWFRTFIFLPTIRKSGSLVLAMVLIFFANYFFHVFQGIFFALFAPYEPLRSAFLYNRFCFFSAHAAVLYIALKTERCWPSEKTRRAWWGVLATNLAMILVHLI
ncbi:MAG: hypothetical protein ACXVCS_14470 [Bdellovibrionota bacterium]